VERFLVRNLEVSSVPGTGKPDRFMRATGEPRDFSSRMDCCVTAQQCLELGSGGQGDVLGRSART
jgi:hypothetical protein